MLLDTWFSNYRKYEHLIDERLVCVNNIGSTIEDDDVIRYYKSLETEKIKIFYKYRTGDRGLILTELYNKSSGDTIFLMEDDNYVMDL